MANSILRLPTVRSRVGYSRSSIYSHVADGSFPKPIRLGERAIGWLESDIEQWIASRVEESRNPTGKAV
jgi:prophage regulatory protein